MSPMAQPATTPRPTAANSGQPAQISMPLARPQNAYVEPTERSTSPAIRTKVMPTAMIPSSEICRPTLSRFSEVRKPPVAKVRNRHSARRAKKTPASRAHRSCDRLNDPRVGARAAPRTTSTIRIHSRFRRLETSLSWGDRLPERPRSSRLQTPLQERAGGDLLQRLVIAIFAHALEGRVLDRIVGADIAPAIGVGTVGVGAMQEIAIENERVARFHFGIFMAEAFQRCFKVLLLDIRLVFFTNVIEAAELVRALQKLKAAVFLRRLVECD